MAPQQAYPAPTGQREGTISPRVKRPSGGDDSDDEWVDAAQSAAAAEAVEGTTDAAALIQALRKHIAALEDEMIVKGEVTRTLGAQALLHKQEGSVFQQQCQQHEQMIRQLSQAVAECQQQVFEAAPRAQQLEHRVKQLEEELTAAEQTVSKPLKDEIASLTLQKHDLESQMTDWKQKVKEALKDGKRREQQLQSSEITLQTEIKQLQEKVNEMTFQLHTLSVYASKQRVAKEIQTNISVPCDSADNTLQLGASPSGSPTIGGGAARRRRSMLEARGPSIGGESPAITFASSPLTEPPPLPLRSDAASRFPHPLSPLSAHVIGGGSALSPSGGKSPPRLDDASIPEPPPFIVAVHFNTSEGWSIDTKHRVSYGMTVASLIQQCSDQFNQRFSQDIQAEKMCLRMNHDKAKRSVVLHPLRELHSFSYFQKCQREGWQIILFLSPRDELHEYVMERIARDESL